MGEGRQSKQAFTDHTVSTAPNAIRLASRPHPTRLIGCCILMEHNLMEIYIIRHAQSTNNTLMDQNKRVCDPQLTELGKHQAEILAQHLAQGKGPFIQRTQADDCHGYDITHLYCSPMWRALQTAQPIGQALELAPEVWVDVHEYGGIFLDRGEAGGIVGCPGKSRSEMLAEFPDYILPADVTERGWWHQGREDRSACYGRAIKVARKLRGMAENDERIAIVSHGGFIDALLKALLNHVPSPQVFYYHFNAAISRIDLHHNGRLDVRYFNRVDHLSLDWIS
jgi:broad specificity phosphatase PhoE